MPRRQRLAAVAVLAALVLATGAFALTPASASVNTQLATARDSLANCQLLAASKTATSSQRQWARDCVSAQQAIIKLLGGMAPTPTQVPPSPTPGSTPTPTVAPTTPAPTLVPTTPAPTTVAPTTPPATTGPVVGCPAWPATPDAACTGYKHTGVTLKDCDSRITAPGTYDGCRFTGGLTIQSSGVKVTRSLVDRGHVESVYPAAYDLKGVVLEDVQILGPGDDGSAAIGNSNYTCRRCDISAGNRGFALGDDVLIVDSYAHDFWVQPKAQQQSNSAHQTAISTHGGSGVQILHSTLKCASDAYACSSGFSFYSEDAPGISDVLVQNCYITTDAGYGMLFGTLITGKPYGITNTRILDNVIGSSEYGPVANWPSSQAGNIWQGNKTPSGAVAAG